jgi:para-nitrobenzyl esterase
MQITPAESSASALAATPWTYEYLDHQPISEDCLYLNVWSPKASARSRLPVMVWIHGGAFMVGSGAVPIYDGEGLAEKGIVVVTVNYRLGAFGFLAHPELTKESAHSASGNYGLMDQMAALKWVRANISGFGGDPRRVTIAGQSAGAASIGDLIASPTAVGLFRGAIAESGTGVNLFGRFATLDQAEAAGVTFTKALGVESIADLRKIPASQIVAQRGRFGHIIDGWILPAAPGGGNAVSPVPLLTGFVANEAGMALPGGTPEEQRAALAMRYAPLSDDFLSLYRDLNPAQISQQANRDRDLASLAIWSKELPEKPSSRLYVYLFDHVEPGPDAARFGAFHTSEVPYVLRTLDKSPPSVGRQFAAVDREVSNLASAYWVNFIKTGNPNGAGLQNWPAFTQETQEVLHLDEAPDATLALTPEKLAFFQDFFNRGGVLGLF